MQLRAAESAFHDAQAAEEKALEVVQELRNDSADKLWMLRGINRDNHLKYGAAAKKAFETYVRFSSANGNPTEPPVWAENLYDTAKMLLDFHKVKYEEMVTKGGHKGLLIVPDKQASNKLNRVAYGQFNL